MLYSSFLFIYFNISLQGFQWFLLVNGEKKCYNNLIYGKRGVQAVENPPPLPPFLLRKTLGRPMVVPTDAIPTGEGEPPTSPPPNS